MHPLSLPRSQRNYGVCIVRPLIGFNNHNGESYFDLYMDEVPRLSQPVIAPASQGPALQFHFAILDRSAKNLRPQALRSAKRHRKIGFRIDTGKFLPAKTTDQIKFLTNDGTALAGEPTQHFISGSVPVTIVDLFEMIKIHDHQGKRLSVMERAPVFLI
jgi:hypothetical protein